MVLLHSHARCAFFHFVDFTSLAFLPSSANPPICAPVALIVSNQYILTLTSQPATSTTLLASWTGSTARSLLKASPFISCSKSATSCVFLSSLDAPRAALTATAKSQTDRFLFSNFLPVFTRQFPTSFPRLQLIQNFLYWSISTLAREPHELLRLSSFLRGLESAGSACGFGISSRKQLSYFVPLGINVRSPCHLFQTFEGDRLS
jgi:hypothetical protein